jgi:two-component system nitrogen regulation sensor histidine kinase NtrY
LRWSLGPGRLPTRLALAFSGLVLVSVAGVTWATLALVRSSFRSEAERSLVDGAARLEAELQSLRRGAEARVGELLADPDLSRLIGALDRGQWSREDGRVVTWAQSEMEGSGLTLLELVDPAGTIVSSGHWPGSAGFPSGGDVGGGPFVAVESLREGPAPAVLASGELRGLRGVYRLRGGHLLDEGLLDRLQITSGGPVALVSLEGRFDARFSREWTLARGGSGGPAWRDVPAVEGSGGPNGGEGGVREGDTRHTRPALKRTPRESFLVVASAPGGTGNATRFLLARSTAPLAALQDRIAVMTLVFAAGGLALSWAGAVVLSRRITRPLEDLAEGARRIAGGDLETRVPERGSVELTALARSFNRMSTDLERNREELIRAERIATWREIARRIAHEIKNALSPIQLSLENVRKAFRSGHPEMDRILEESTTAASAEIAGLDRMVAEFSEFARMPPLEPGPYDLHDVLRRAARTACGEDGYELRLGARPADGRGDADQLYRAFLNLIKNAREAMEEAGTWGGSHPLRVEARRLAGDLFEVAIHDRGPGLEAAEAERIFTPYFTTKSSGTGLGLPLVHRIVTEHGGTVRVEGRRGEGSVFTVRLRARVEVPGRPGESPS